MDIIRFSPGYTEEAIECGAFKDQIVEVGQWTDTE